MKLFTESKMLYEEDGNYKLPSMQEIDNGTGMTTLYRVAFKNQLESLFKYGYNRAFTGTKGGNMYGLVYIVLSNLVIRYTMLKQSPNMVIVLFQ